MVINYDVEKLRRTLQDFYNATGIYMDLLKEDLSYIGDHGNWEYNRYCKAVQSTPLGKKKCLYSDNCLLERCRASKKEETHICYAGLVDIAVPILYGDSVLGYILFGQMKTGKDFGAVEACVRELGLDLTKMEEYYSELPFFDSEKIQSICSIAAMLVKHILLENMLLPNYDEKVQQAVAYIDEHLEEPLTIQRIARSVNISKSVLYNRFHACFQCTVSAYINSERVERSIPLLIKTDLSMEEIAQKVGFSNASYFGRIFKKLKNTSPLKYRFTHR